MSRASPPIGLPPGLNIESLTAPLVFGTIFNAYLYGVLTVQVYLYYLTFQQDARYIKTLVYGVFLLDTAATIMGVFDAYKWFAEGFGSILALDRVQLSTLDTPCFGAIIASVVQGFYCYRIFRINKKAWPIVLLVGLIALAEIGAGLYVGPMGIKLQTFSNNSDPGMLKAVYVIFVGAAVADVLIAVTMITLLGMAKTHIQRQSNFVLRRIIALTAETNLLSTTFAILTFILILTYPNANYFTCPSMILGKIYSNSMLLLLNNRQYLALHTGSTEIQSTGTVKMTTFRGNPSKHPLNPSRSIQIDVNSAVVVDQEPKESFQDYHRYGKM